MKFYETHFDDYCKSVETFNFHEELIEQINNFPEKLIDFENIIIYGPSGVGKYSQMLYLLKKYSPSLLKYEKKITSIIDKQSYIYKISDIHYEIDMALLGCNSRMLWHEIFQQIVDIVSVKQDKHGIIVCKNFHTIHNELLEILYSYLQQYSNTSSNINQIQIKFVLITEHLSFIPNNIINGCYILRVKRPSKESYIGGINNSSKFGNDITGNDIKKSKILTILDKLKTENFSNIKEINSFHLLKSSNEIPIDNFNTICDNIINEMSIINECNQKNVDIGKFRDNIYDILIYNLDVIDCIWYIFTYFVNEDLFDIGKINVLMEKMFIFLKQYGNNYRAIFHIEFILFSMICTLKVHSNKEPL
jgi:hypothetical protein